MSIASSPFAGRLGGWVFSGFPFFSDSSYLSATRILFRARKIYPVAVLIYPAVFLILYSLV